MMRSPTPGGPCPVQTDDYDWGNYCPRDPHGVHRCDLSATHRQVGPVSSDEPERPAQPCKCACGTTRRADLPVRSGR